jgi:hypothetical protein
MLKKACCNFFPKLFAFMSSQTFKGGRGGHTQTAATKARPESDTETLSYSSFQLPNNK